MAESSSKKSLLHVDKIKADAKSWSLAGDADLLITLENFSSEFLCVTESLERKISDIENTVERTGISVSLSETDFSMLAYSQFIESRVYDDDENSLKIDERSRPKTESEKQTNAEQQFIDNVAKCVKLTVNMVDKYYEKVFAFVVL